MSGSNGAAFAIGNFDGVHRGHQAVLEKLCGIASERELLPRLLTFEPHPAVTLGRPAPARLTTLERKRELCARHCAGLEVVARPFSAAFSHLSPELFAQQVLRDELDARVVMVGRDFRFGHRRSGGFVDLEHLGAALGFEALAEPLVSDSIGVISSTRVRAELARGDVAAARAMLGRPHRVGGRVGAGAQRGRTLGFPTCNLTEVAEALPAHGVYAVLVEAPVDGELRRLRGVANVGVRPTLGEAEPRVSAEVHLFDVEADLYGAYLTVHFWAQLRPEQRFASLDELRAQIARDADAARALLVDAAADPAAAPGWY